MEHLTGSRVVFRIDGNKIAYANSISYEETIEHEPIEVLDELNVKEHVPVAYRVNFSVESFRIVNQSVKQLGLMPVFDEILQSGDLTAEMVDSKTGVTVAVVLGVKLTSRSGNVPTRGVARETLSFVATRILDEAEV